MKKKRPSKHSIQSRVEGVEIRLSIAGIAMRRFLEEVILLKARVKQLEQLQSEALRNSLK